MAKKQTPLGNLVNTLKGEEPAKLTDEVIQSIRTAATSAVSVELMLVGVKEGKKGLEAHRAALEAAGIKLTRTTGSGGTKKKGTIEQATGSMLATVRAFLKLAPKGKHKPLPNGALAVLVVTSFTSAYRMKVGADLTASLFEGMEETPRNTVSKIAQRAIKRLAPVPPDNTKTVTPQEKVEGLAKRIAPDVGANGIAKLVQAFKDALEAALAETQVEA